MNWLEIGRVIHFYNKISVAIIELSGTLQGGQKIRVIGPKTEIEQTVDSMQVEHRNIDRAKPGDLVGLKVIGKVREGDAVFTGSES